MRRVYNTSLEGVLGFSFCVGIAKMIQTVSRMEYRTIRDTKEAKTSLHRPNLEHLERGT
jgi:hypothetical protein